jgi:periplasmic protein TonB
MPTGSRNEVFTISEIARAAGVPTGAVQTLIGRGELNFVAGTPYIAVPNAPRTARHLREAALALHAQPGVALFTRTDSAPPRTRKPAVASLTAHATVALLAVLLSMGHTESASIVDSPHEESHLVFLLSPGPGGGGGGGGLRQPTPPPKIARRGEPRLRVSVPRVSEKPVIQAPEESPKPTPVERVIQPAPEPAPEPEPAKVIVAPVETVASNERDREGAIEHAVDGPDSHGPGVNGGVGSGQGTGNGEGLGAGIGDGAGGGTGGGPYRPGSGIEPPRLLREVKAEYTEEARRRGITGDVLLEIVVRRDGGVGDVRVLQGLGAGLDQRAMTAVKQWRFDAARRKGVPVDVLVEVAVEFTLR